MVREVLRKVVLKPSLAACMVIATATVINASSVEARG